ncbi:MAG: hypothetical protein ACM3ZF_14485 [Mycobacterium leprae]
MRRARLVRLEAEALAHATRVSPWDLSGPLAPLEPEAAGTEAAAARGLGGELLERLPRYEAHLSRELDRSLSRYPQLQQDRRRTIEPDGC